MRMAMLLPVILLAMHLTIIKTDLTVPHHISATWKRPVTLPCSYSPVKYTQNTVTWLFKGSRILESDSTGDHTFLTKYRGRLSIPKDREGGDVSLTIEDLRIDDRGTYTCKVSLTRIGTSDKTSKEAAIELTVKKGDTAGPATTQKLRTSSTEQVSTTEPAATTKRTRAPSSTKDDAVKQTHHSTRIPDIIMDSTEAPGNKGRPQATKQSSTTERKTPEYTKERNTSSSVSLYLIILVVILSLALFCTLIAVLVTRSKRKTADRVYEIPAMSVLNTQENQDSPAANGCQVNVCQINFSQTNGCQNNELARPRKDNDYQLAPTNDQKPESFYQDIQSSHHENEYELLLTEKEECHA